MANAICEHYPGDPVAAGKDSGEISTAISAGGHGNNVTVQAGKLQGTVRSLISCPQLHAAKGANYRLCTIGEVTFDLFGVRLCIHVSTPTESYSGCNLGNESDRDQFKTLSFHANIMDLHRK
jgi:hypothetical protein